MTQNIVERLRAEERRQQKLHDHVVEVRDKREYSFADLNGIKHAVSGRDPVLEPAADELERVRSAIEQAYGILWRDTHRGSAEKSIAARKALFSVLDKEGQRRGIAHAIAIYGETTEAESIAGAEHQDEITSLRSLAERDARIEALEQNVVRAEEERDDARQIPWPRWANEIRKALEKYGVEADDEGGWDLPTQLDEWLEGAVENETKRANTAESARDTAVEALRFYAKPQHWRDGMLLEHILPTAEADAGDLARATLTKLGAAK